MLAVPTRFLASRILAAPQLQKNTRHIFLKLKGGGSLIIALPALLGLRRAYPDAEFTLVCTSGVKAYAELTGIFDSYLIIDDATPLTLIVSAWHAMRESFRATRCIDLEPNSLLAAVFTMLTCAQTRAGFVKPEQPGRAAAYTTTLAFNINAPIYIYYDQLCAALGGIPALCPRMQNRHAKQTARDCSAADHRQNPRPHRFYFRLSTRTHDAAANMGRSSLQSLCRYAAAPADLRRIRRPASGGTPHTSPDKSPAPRRHRQPLRHRQPVAIRGANGSLRRNLEHRFRPAASGAAAWRTGAIFLGANYADTAFASPAGFAGTNALPIVPLFSLPAIGIDTALSRTKSVYDKHGGRFAEPATVLGKMKNFWNWIAKPPYRGLPWLVWLYIVLAVFILPFGGVFTGHMIGFDDQVRMTQVLNWVNGADWYDRTIMRANPPEGFTTIWSRIVDIPIAAVIVVAQQFVSQKTASLVAATILPLAEILILFAAATYFVRPLVGKNKARLIVLFLVFSSLINNKYFSLSGFLVGQASHRPWYAILDLTLFGSAARLAMGSAVMAPILMLGGSVALLTAVGIEGYPMIAGAAAMLAFTAWLGQRPLVASRAGDSLLLGALAGLLLLPMHQPLQHFFTISFAEPSILGILLITMAGAFLKAESVILRRFDKNKIASALMLSGLAAIAACGLILAFPGLLDGPAAGLSPTERQMALSEHYEARSIWSISRSMWEFAGLAVPLVLGLAAGVFAIVSARQARQRAVYICYFGFALLGSGMTSLFSRYYHHAMTTCCAWLLWIWEQIKARLKRNTHYSLLVFAAFIALGPFWMLLLPGVIEDAPMGSQIVFFPSRYQTTRRTMQNSCPWPFISISITPRKLC